MKRDFLNIKAVNASVCALSWEESNRVQWEIANNFGQFVNDIQRRKPSQRV